MRRFFWIISGLILTAPGIFFFLNNLSESPSYVHSKPAVTFARDPNYSEIVSKNVTSAAGTSTLPVFDDPALTELITSQYTALDPEQTRNLRYRVLALTPEHFSLVIINEDEPVFATFARSPATLLRTQDVFAAASSWNGPENGSFGFRNETFLIPVKEELKILSLSETKSALDLSHLEILAPETALVETAIRAREKVGEEITGRVESEKTRLSLSTECEIKACVSLTFDDGPDVHTELLLDILRTNQVPATFYVLGQQAAKHPETVKRIVADGHTLGNHTYHHPDLATLSAEAAFLELDKTQNVIYELTRRYPLTYRPPYGSRRSFEQYSLDQVLWSQDSLDWQLRDKTKIITQATTGVEAGDIILLHDTHPETVAAVPDIIRILKEKGFTLVTVEDLLANTDYTPESRIVESRTNIREK